MHVKYGSTSHGAYTDVFDGNKHSRIPGRIPGGIAKHMLNSARLSMDSIPLTGSIKEIAGPKKPSLRIV